MFCCEFLAKFSEHFFEIIPPGDYFWKQLFLKLLSQRLQTMLKHKPRYKLQDKDVYA